MLKLNSKQEGFTLVEILIVLALLGILVAVVVPNLTGFLGRGKDEAYSTDSRTLQAAVDGYYTDNTISCPGQAGRCYPTWGGNAGNPPFVSVTRDTESDNYYLDVDALISANYLRGVPESSGGENDPNGGGSYSWFVSSNGVVSSTLDGDPVGKEGFQDGIYP